MAFDRAAHERISPLRENARSLLVDGDRFAIDGDRLATVARDGDLYLGRLDGAPLFLAEGHADTMLDFRTAAGQLSAEHVELLSYALGMLNWTRRTRFCSVCGSALDVKQQSPQDRKKARPKDGESTLDTDFQIQTYIAHPGSSSGDAIPQEQN